MILKTKFTAYIVRLMLYLPVEMLIKSVPMCTKSCDATSRMNKHNSVSDKVPQPKKSPIVTNTLVTTIASTIISKYDEILHCCNN